MCRLVTTGSADDPHKTADSSFDNLPFLMSRVLKNEITIVKECGDAMVTSDGFSLTVTSSKLRGGPHRFFT